MQTEPIENAVEYQSAEATALKHHYCSFCGAVIPSPPEPQIVDGVLTWTCPECGFPEPA